MRKHITFASIPLLTFVLCGGCEDVWLEPDVPPPPPSLPTEGNLPRDAYDVTNHRLLLGDCSNNTLVALDLATGEQDVLIDTWPWTEPGRTVCVREVVVDRDGRRAFATVDRAIPDPPEIPGGLNCYSRDLVDIDLETREVAEIENIDYTCCDDFCGHRQYSAPQLDEYRSRLLILEEDVVPDFGTYQLTSRPLGAGQDAQRYGLSPDCPPDGDECDGEPWPEFEAFTLDPATPNEHALLITWEYSIPNFLDGQFMIDKYDIVNGTRVSRQPVQLLDRDQTRGNLVDASIDIEKQRLLLTWGKEESWIVVAVDLVTGEETLLYDGTPASGGARLTCRPEVAFDLRERRLLLVERSDYGTDCTDVFAVDADTGAFKRIAEITR